MHRSIVLVLVVITCLPANARLRDYVNLERFSDRNLGTWSAGDGDRIWINTKCVASSNYNNAYSDPPPVVSPAAVHEAYQLKVTDTAAAAGYYFYLDDDPSNIGNARIPVEIRHRDVKVGTSFETLADDVYDSHSHTGQFKSCGNGNNSELEATLSETNLENARAGNYRGRFVVQAIGAGGRTHSRNLVLSLAVSEIVRVSSLDNITLGNWSGSGDMNGDETFCVYSNNDSAGYTLEVSSPNETAGQFRLANGGSTEFVNYSLAFADSLAGAGVTVTGAPSAGTGNNEFADCDSTNNARISVTVPAANLGAATPDSYSDTITLLVAPL